jgi:hypothetical protein
MIEKSVTKVFFILSFLIINAVIAKAQDKGRWIIVSNHPKAITYVDTLKFRDFDTRAYHVGKYKVRAWRPGGVLIDTSIIVRKDSISFLKLKINDTPAYAEYKEKKVIFQLKRWTPKVVIIATAITLQKLYKNSKNKVDKLEKTYQNYKLQYDDLYTVGDVEMVKVKSEKTYNEYLKEVKNQNKFSALRLVVPALFATTVIIDLSNKKPAPYIEVPLLTFNNQTYYHGEGNLGFNFICKF